MLETALRWYNQGITPLPLIWGTKRAAVPWIQYQTTRPTEEIIARWFNGRRRNLALLTGPASGGLCVLDFDVLPRYFRWCKAHPNLAKTHTVTTPRPGRHVYLFVHDLPDRTLGLPGIDVKVTGYVLAPPSQIGKAQYQVANEAPVLHVDCIQEVLPEWDEKAARGRALPNRGGGQRSPQSRIEGNSHTHHENQPSIADHTTIRPPGASSRHSTKSIIADIKANLPITELLSEYTTLHPSDPTGRYWLMRCPMPWHNDQHPSFWADAVTGRCSCFAPWCRAKFGGRPLDVVGLTRYLERLTLAQAIAALARRLGL